jgi:hypothetical protein
VSATPGTGPGGIDAAERRVSEARARTFLVECYLTGIEETAVAEAGRRAREVVEGLRRRGEDIEYRGATLVPDDEVVFHAFVASGVALVEAASRQAGLRYERIVESIGVAGDPGAVGRVERPAGGGGTGPGRAG